MPLPLFTESAFCKQQLSCKQCRDPNDSTYRDGWEKVYRVPKDWECPKGIKIGGEIPSPLPASVPSHLLGTLVDLPDSEESKKINKDIAYRADLLRPLCLKCNEFNSIDCRNLVVDCKKGYKCCGGGLTRGFVHLGSGFCLAGKWQDLRIENAPK